jgi:hypothetical protein
MQLKRINSSAQCADIGCIDARARNSASAPVESTVLELVRACLLRRNGYRMAHLGMAPRRGAQRARFRTHLLRVLVGE